MTRRSLALSLLLAIGLALLAGLVACFPARRRL